MFSPFTLFILTLITNYIAWQLRRKMLKHFSAQVCAERGINIKPTKEEKEKYMPNLFVYYFPSIIAIIINVIAAIQFYKLSA